MANRYQIIVKGHLDSDWASWFGDIQLSYDAQDNSVFTGDFPDQPALYGILDRLRDLNLTLLSVTRLEPESSSQ